MSWRADYRPGSFRGAPFVTVAHDRGGGRRVALHEFPLRDDPLAEDMGRQARRYSVTCHLIGADYRVGRDRLLDALEAPGPGTLVHPWFGTAQVVVEGFTQSESTDEGGIAHFDIQFAEAGLADRAFAPTPDTAGQSADLADRLIEAQPRRFADRFTVAGAPGFVTDATAELVSGLSAAAMAASALTGGAGPLLRTLDAGLRLLPEGVAVLARQPLALGEAIVRLATTVVGLAPTPRARSAALVQLAPATEGLPPIVGRTPARARERANRAATLDALRVTIAAEQLRAAAATRFPSGEDATAERDRLTARLDAWALDAADRGDDVAAAHLDEARRAITRDLTVRGGALARLSTLTPLATEPALVTAHRATGADAGLVDRAADLTARNRVVHPGFVPGGSPVRLLSDG